MPIIYSLVARGATVLAEHAAASGNFIEVSRLILDKISSTQTGRMSYSYDRYTTFKSSSSSSLLLVFRFCFSFSFHLFFAAMLIPSFRHYFHYLASEGLIFLCMSDEEFPRRIAFAFLEDIKNRFMAVYRKTYQTAMAFGMNDEFSRVLQRQMEYFSYDPSVDKIGMVQAKVDETKKVMVENIERVLDRGEKIELLVSRTEQLQDQSYKFSRESKRLRWAMCYTNVKLWIAIIVVIAVRFFLVASHSRPSYSSCSPSCSPSPSPSCPSSSSFLSFLFLVWMCLAGFFLSLVLTLQQPQQQILIWLISSFICGFNYKKCK
ncbi:Vesicle-associated membrane protein, variant 2 [Balamuthia mandrillaris]